MVYRQDSSHQREYSSTIKLSLISDERSERSGLALYVPSILLASTSSHAGTPREQDYLNAILSEFSHFRDHGVTSSNKSHAVQH